MLKRNFRINHRIQLLILIIFFAILSMIFVLPFVKTNKAYFADDLYFHLQRIEEIRYGIQHGEWFTYLYSHTFNSVGYPLNLFYPWVTLLPFSIATLLVHNHSLAIYLGISFYTFLTLCICYLSCFKFSKNKIQSIITAVVYAFSSYRVLNIYTRFALGEFIALTFLPFCLYGVYAIFKGNYHDWNYLAIGLSAIILSHVLSAFIDSIFLCCVAMGLCLHMDNI